MSTAVKYKLLNENEFVKHRGDTRVFVYLLLLDLKEESGADLPPKIFYLGQASSYVRRFSNHAQLQWYSGKFDKPAKALIAGLVPQRLADEAEKELVEEALEAGYLLTNAVHNKDQDRVWTTEATLTYFAKSVRTQGFLEAWRAKYVKEDPSFSAEAYAPAIPDSILTGEKSKRPKRGTTSLAILSLLESASLNGYGIMQEFEIRTEGRWTPKSGTIYPLLNQLVENGKLVSDNGVYKLTEHGKQELSQNREFVEGLLSGENRNASGAKPSPLSIASGKLIAALQTMEDFGTDEQVKVTIELVDELRRKVYIQMTE